MSLHTIEDRLICVISDSGPGIGAMALPDVALTRYYSTAGTLGMGYKLMIRFADRVYLATGPKARPWQSRWLCTVAKLLLPRRRVHSQVGSDLPLRQAIIVPADRAR